MEGGDQAVDHDYVFDPTNRLTTKDCDTDGQCESAWSKTFFIYLIIIRKIVHPQNINISLNKWYLYHFTFSFGINLDTRKGAIIFNKPKAVRLAFHDCMPYEDGGGCDGCLNFEENEDEHNVLQHSVAILVIQFYL